MKLARPSLSAYPDQRYFDPGRPSWLPYWIDTPTESAMKYRLYPSVPNLRPTPPPPPAQPPSVPVFGGSPEQAVASTARGSMERSLARWDDFYSRSAWQLERDAEEAAADGIWSYTYAPLFILAGAVVLLFYIRR